MPTQTTTRLFAPCMSVAPGHREVLAPPMSHAQAFEWAHEIELRERATGFGVQTWLEERTNAKRNAAAIWWPFKGHPMNYTANETAGAMRVYCIWANRRGAPSYADA